jgi:uncharacterized protein (TIGR02757 family)
MPEHQLSSRYLNALYRRYNRREYITSDPIRHVHRYDDNGNREVVGLIASTLAYGRVVQIQRSIDDVLRRLGSPRAAVVGATRGELTGMLEGFKHRFTTDGEMASLLFGVGCLIRAHGSLGACFADHCRAGDETVLPALGRFAEALRERAEGSCDSLLPRPRRGSACKRLNLYLRWMAREDDVDLGVWRGVPAHKLIVPLDTHMHRIGLRFGLTERRSADIRTALEITRGFRAFAKRDPVKYDFALTRPGILGVDRAAANNGRGR